MSRFSARQSNICFSLKVQMVVVFSVDSAGSECVGNKGGTGACACLYGSCARRHYFCFGGGSLVGQAKTVPLRPSVRLECNANMALCASAKVFTSCSAQEGGALRAVHVSPRSQCRNTTQRKDPCRFLRRGRVMLVGMRGFEPPVSASRTRRSTRLSHIPLSRGRLLAESNQKGKRLGGWLAFFNAMHCNGFLLDKLEEM